MRAHRPCLQPYLERARSPCPLCPWRLHFPAGALTHSSQNAPPTSRTPQLCEGALQLRERQCGRGACTFLWPARARISARTLRALHAQFNFVSHALHSCRDHTLGQGCSTRLAMGAPHFGDALTATLSKARPSIPTGSVTSLAHGNAPIHLAGKFSHLVEDFLPFPQTNSHRSPIPIHHLECLVFRTVRYGIVTLIEKITFRSL